MGLDTDLEFDKYCKVVRNPKVGCISHHYSSKSEPRAEKGKPSTRSYAVRNVDDRFTEISFGRSRSSSCKSMANVPTGVAGNVDALKRDSLYQDSKEVRKMKTVESFEGSKEVRKMETVEFLEGRQKIEFSPSSDTSLSFRIFNSALLDKTCPLVDQRISTLLSSSDDRKPLSDGRKSCAPDPQDFLDLSFRFPSTPASALTRNISSDGSFDISMDMKDRRDCSPGTTKSGREQQSKFKCDQAIGSLNDGNGHLERDSFFTLHKSSSEKVGKPYSRCRTESDNSKHKLNAHLSPFRRMLDPIMKSKSLRSSPVSREEVGGPATAGLENSRRNRTFHKSLLNDFSKTTCKTESGTRFVKKDYNRMFVASSPAHLHGILTFELKHGVPYFEFSFKDPEDFLSAKTWRANNSFSWVYTFHSKNRRRKSNSSGWATRERHKESPMVGQMQVSCFLLSEMRNSGVFDNSMVTEFVLYDIMHARNDIMHARRALEAEDGSHGSTNSVETTKGTCIENIIMEDIPCEVKDSCDVGNHKHQTGHVPDGDDVDDLIHYPWAPADLHPNLEIAAIVIEAPFEKRESLKDKQGDKLGRKEHQSVFDSSVLDHRSATISSGINGANVTVITSAGAHGLPSKKAGRAPSPLLQRWRSGGCCDCGGWDMACPLLVFDSCNDQKMKENPLMENQPIELFFQGAKDKFPALTIKATAEGQYAVDFHAHLSKLQAFSICLAILHGCEASTAVEQEKKPHNFHCNSLKVLLNEEARFLMEAVADKDKRSLIARA